jgi:hypothetical protein
MEASAALAFPHDRVCDWYVEMKRVEAELPSLPPAARRAVGRVLSSLREEVADGQSETWRLDEMLALLAGRV